MIKTMNSVTMNVGIELDGEVFSRMLALLEKIHNFKDKAGERMFANETLEDLLQLCLFYGKSMTEELTIGLVKQEQFWESMYKAAEGKELPSEWYEDDAEPDDPLDEYELMEESELLKAVDNLGSIAEDAE